MPVHHLIGYDTIFRNGLLFYVFGFIYPQSIYCVVCHHLIGLSSTPQNINVIIWQILLPTVDDTINEHDLTRHPKKSILFFLLFVLIKSVNVMVSMKYTVLAVQAA